MNVDNQLIHHICSIENDQESQAQPDLQKISSNDLSQFLKRVCNNIYVLKETEITQESLNKSNEMAKAFKEEKEILKKEVIDESVKIGELFRDKPDVLREELSTLGKEYKNGLNDLDSNRKTYEALLAKTTKERLQSLADKLKKSYAAVTTPNKLNETASRKVETLLNSVSDLHL